MTFDMYARCSIQHVHGCEAAVALVLNCIGHVHVRTIHMAPSGKPWDWYCFAALGVILGVKASCFLQETRLHFNLFDQDDVTRDNCQPTPRPFTSIATATHGIREQLLETLTSVTCQWNNNTRSGH